MDPILERYQALEDKIKEYNPALDAQRLFRAFTYAQEIKVKNRMAVLGEETMCETFEEV